MGTGDNGKSVGKCSFFVLVVLFLHFYRFFFASGRAAGLSVAKKGDRQSSFLPVK